MTSILSRLTAGDQRGPFLLDEIDSMESVDRLRDLFDEFTVEIGRLSDREDAYPRWPFEEGVTAEGPTAKEAQRATRAVFFMLYYYPARAGVSARASAEFRDAFERLIEVGDNFKRRVFEEMMDNARRGMKSHADRVKGGKHRDKEERDAWIFDRGEELKQQGRTPVDEILQRELVEDWEEHLEIESVQTARKRERRRRGGQG